MREQIICAGFGGQGIMFLGKLIALGAAAKGLKVTWMPSYGAEVRGGTAHSMVIISDEDIASPLVSFCDTAIVMNRPSLYKFITNVMPKGLLILNSSLADGAPGREDITILKIPMTDIANKLGNVRIANMVALGAYIKEKKLFTIDMVTAGIKEAFPNNKELVDLNINALEEGLKIR